ncbi:MAG: hypothetical protein ACM3ZU_08085 [Bacteroidota bacterium]
MTLDVKTLLSVEFPRAFCSICGKWAGSGRLGVGWLSNRLSKEAIPTVSVIVSRHESLPVGLA